MGIVDGLLYEAGKVALGSGELCGIVHGLVPGLFFDDGVEGLVGGAGAHVGVEDLAGAGGIEADVC